MAINLSAEGIKKLIDKIASGLQKQIDQLVKNGDSSVEAAQARVGADGTTYETLKRRLDSEKQMNEDDLASERTERANKDNELEGKIGVLDVNLAQTSQEMNDLNTKVGALASSAVFKGSLTNIEIMALTDMVTGDEWYDTTNSIYLRYNGTDWINVGAGTNLGQFLTTQDASWEVV